MSKRTNHNSFLLLTTLGVYIGLVLVGAPTGIIAMPAATTRNFDISEEIEFTENFDNDPDTAENEDGILPIFSFNDLESISFAGYFESTPAVASSLFEFQLSFPGSELPFAHFSTISPNSHFAGKRTETLPLGAVTADDSPRSKRDNIRIHLSTHLARAELIA